MACYKPLRGARGPGGKLVEECAHGAGEALEVACGQCIGCRLERSRQWAVRLMHEASQHPRSCFVTLTYSDEQLPPDHGLQVRHFQLFMKRLRKWESVRDDLPAGQRRRIRFFHCGEYGEQTDRPHYHAILFGEDFAHDRRFYRRTRLGDTLYSSPTLEELWSHGFAPIGDLTFESAAYVARYCLKKVTGPPAAARYEFVDTSTGEVFNRKPEYVTMSRRPGIGAEWWRKFGQVVTRDDFVVMNGKKMRPPRFYDRCLEKVDPAKLEEIKSERVSMAEKYADNNTRERLRVREQVQAARLSRLRRGFES